MFPPPAPQPEHGAPSVDPTFGTPWVTPLTSLGCRVERGPICRTFACRSGHRRAEAGDTPVEDSPTVDDRALLATGAGVAVEVRNPCLVEFCYLLVRQELTSGEFGRALQGLRYEQRYRKDGTRTTLPIGHTCEASQRANTQVSILPVCRDLFPGPHPRPCEPTRCHSHSSASQGPIKPLHRPRAGRYACRRYVASASSQCLP